MKNVNFIKMKLFRRFYIRFVVVIYGSTGDLILVDYEEFVKVLVSKFILLVYYKCYFINVIFFIL